MDKPEKKKIISSGQEVNEATLRQIASINYNIMTASILELEQKIGKWTKVGNCGGIVYGRARLGKTRAIKLISDDLKRKYGESFPVLLWNITDHAVTEKNFYLSALMMLGIGEITRSNTTLYLKERLLNALIMLANDTPYRRIVIFIDEAYLLHEKDFKWLMDLYNNLNMHDIQLITFLFGTNELKDLKNSYIANNMDQIVSRFMINEFQFRGISTPEEMMMCLISIDNTCVTDPRSGNTNVSLKDFYFPDAAEDESFKSLCNVIWDAFSEVKINSRLRHPDIPMKYFIYTILELLDDYGAYSNCPIRFPSKANIIDCIMESGYAASTGASA